MFDKKRLKKFFNDRDKLTVYDEIETVNLWDEMTEFICESEENIKGLIEYMYDEMNKNEYETMTEIIDDIVINQPSFELVKAMKYLQEKYEPKEITEKWDIVKYIENIVKMNLEKGSE